MMKVGQIAETVRSYSRRELEEFCRLSGHPLVESVPEPLVAALFSYLLGVKLPGPGTNYLKQDMRFHTQAPVDAPLTARVEITRLRPDKHLVDLRSTCHRPDGTLICEGRSLVLARDIVT
ncbi:MAG: phosphate acetyltransferase [Alphaproteobacteria bacterium]|nr:phosphate acetyltransferase [Alphaproteobacteria bacterium]